MDRRVQWALVGLLAVALAYGAIVTRYEYPPQAAGRLRVDRWTNTVQVWGCLEYVEGAPKFAPSALDRLLFRGRGGDDQGCRRYGWQLRR